MCVCIEARQATRYAPHVPLEETLVLSLERRIAPHFLCARRRRLPRAGLVSVHESGKGRRRACSTARIYVEAGAGPTSPKDGGGAPGEGHWETRRAYVGYKKQTVSRS